MKIAKVNRSLLIIDDDQTFCQAVRDDFSSSQLEVKIAHTAKEGLRLCANTPIDVVLLDQKLPDGEGHSLCHSLLGYNDHTKIIFITAFPNFDNAVRAIKAGAYDYLSKPMELEELHLAIERALKVVELEKLKQCYTYGIDKEKNSHFLVGDFGGNKHILELINLSASVDSPLLLTGETGTGKNLVARAIHYKGNEPAAPFIGINCAALPENLVEAELFGYEKGAFTGATSARKGLFELAENGTLFLDEIGAMPLHLQAKLLGVLDDGVFRRLGGHSLIQVNPRIISATNANLETMIKEKIFREDLYYRLSVLHIHIPPLRERTSDIPLLCDFFCQRLGKNRAVVLPDSEIDILKRYRWPGNTRELKNIIERSLILHKDVLHPSDFIDKTGILAVDDCSGPYPGRKQEFKTLEEMNTKYISEVLTAFSGNLSRSATALGISLSTLKRKMKQR